MNTDHLLEQHSAYFKTTKLSLASLLVTKFGEMFNSIKLIQFKRIESNFNALYKNLLLN